MTPQKWLALAMTGIFLGDLCSSLGVLLRWEGSPRLHLYLWMLVAWVLYGAALAAAVMAGRAWGQG